MFLIHAAHVLSESSVARHRIGSGDQRNQRTERHANSDNDVVDNKEIDNRKGNEYKRYSTLSPNAFPPPYIAALSR